MKNVSGIILICVLAFGQTMPAADPVSNNLNSASWTHLVNLQLVNKKADENDVSELFARLLLSLRGKDLSPEAWEKTKLMANSPRNGFGVINNGGFKWMLANFVVIGNGLQIRIRDAEKNDELQKARMESLALQLSAAQTQLAANEARIKNLEKQNDELARSLNEMKKTAAQIASALADIELQPKPKPAKK